ncbi:B12-binding domain-containing radical SAM protein [Coprobacter tertius]|uniref:DUF4080 domain-containing protein n=1 Tax=Coprobacter tertius TaxID=2944915 RepID=A0ABT1MLE0_9BACT|nr:DUF4080 domain-containing protein [Coprobacter tertius]MCP9612701.1 DUF4080 domain-containing protein [Coprobacter tertius]
MKILWIDLNSSYAHASLALPALHAQVKKRNDIEWHIISATINDTPGTVTAEASRCSPDIIASTAWIFNREMLLHIISRLKVLFPESTVILGGPEFLGDNSLFLRFSPYVDCVFRGEGEEEFPHWLNYWNDRSNWNSIKGLCYINDNGEYIDNGIARVNEFEKLIVPEKSPFFNWNKPFVQLETTRGCFNTCTFCVSGSEKPVRTLEISTLRERIENISHHGIRDIRILDRTFNYNTTRAQALLSLFTEFAGKMRFHLEIHPGLLNDGLKQQLETLPDNLLHLEAGIQSLRQEVLDACHRKGDVQKSLEGLRFLCSLTNMETHADLIAGLPFYHIYQIFEDIHTLAHYNAGEIQLELLKLLPGTEMRRKAAELGIYYSPLPPYEVLKTNDITPEELQQARRLSRLLDGYYNGSPWREITRQLILSESGFLKEFLDFLTDTEVIEKPLSTEKRGMLLYDFCKIKLPQRLHEISIAWISNGMSIKKEPAFGIRTKGIRAPQKWIIKKGSYHTSMKLYLLPGKDTDTWFGYLPDKKIAVPDMIALSISK